MSTKRVFLLTSRRSLSTVASFLHQKLTSRRLSPIYDYLSPRPFHLLNLSLIEILPEVFSDSGLTKTLPSVRDQHRMPACYHLVYFPPQVSLSELLTDGTDMLHAPGNPFNRRMWAGGRMTFPLDGGPLLNGQRAVCLEAIRDVTVKGRQEEEKVFVQVERRMAPVEEGEGEEDTRIRLWRNHCNDADNGMVTERRDLVFLRDKPPEQVKVENNINCGNDSRIVKCARHTNPHLLKVLTLHLSLSFPSAKPVPTLISTGG
jgi:hypothetical protein